jgi:hypothetical protein
MLSYAKVQVHFTSNSRLGKKKKPKTRAVDVPCDYVSVVKIKINSLGAELQAFA